MSLKENYLNGSNYIFSPRGKISRERYFYYAFGLDLLYKILYNLGFSFGKDFFPVMCVIGVFLFFVIILKFFNYKKRAYSFLNNNILACLYSIFYIVIGFFIQEYTYFNRILLNKDLYEFTKDIAFSQYENMTVPSFISSDYCNILFYLFSIIGFIMFLFLLFYPTQNVKKEENLVIK